METLLLHMRYTLIPLSNYVLRKKITSSLFILSFFSFDFFIMHPILKADTITWCLFVPEQPSEGQKYYLFVARFYYRPIVVSLDRIVWRTITQWFYERSNLTLIVDLHKHLESPTEQASLCHGQHGASLPDHWAAADTKSLLQKTLPLDLLVGCLFSLYNCWS